MNNQALGAAAELRGREDELRAMCAARGLDYGEVRAALRARTVLRTELADEGLSVVEIANRLAGVEPTR